MSGCHAEGETIHLLRAPIGVVEGDEVLFGKYAGTEIKVDGEEIKILRESDILAKILK